MDERTPLAWVARVALQGIHEEALRRWPLETGGVLLGYTNSDDLVLVVTAAIGPGPNASHRADGFVPDFSYDVSSIAELYERSGRRMTYLGDWHTHPGGSAVLSRTDQQMLAAMARYRPARTPRPVMVVAAGSPSAGWDVRAWRWLPSRWVPRRGRVVELPVREYED